MGIIDSILLKSANFLLKGVDTDKAAQQSKNVFQIGNQYSPGQPLDPVKTKQDKINPWQFQYRVGTNLIITPRTEYRLAPFSLLRQLADIHDITRICIEYRKEQVSGMLWDIVPIDIEDLVNFKSPEKQNIKKFFKKPDKVHNWYDWIGMVLEEVLVIDALTLYKRRTRGGDLYSLDLVDGSTFKPILDAEGRIPLPPNPAYQQIIYGLPYTEWSLDDVIYKPKNRRTTNPYGFSPTEYVLYKINIGLRRDDWQLARYTEGVLPDGGLLGVPEEWTPEQIEAYQSYLDSELAGNTKKRSGGLRVVPGRSSYMPTKDIEYNPKEDEWIARIVANAFGVNPQIFTLQINRATAQVQDTQQTDIGLKPLLTYLENMLTNIIQEDMGFENFKFKFIDQKAEDQKIAIDRNDRYVNRGIFKIDDVRIPLGMVPTNVPAFVMGNDGPVFLTKEYIEARIKSQIKMAELMEQTIKGNAKDVSGEDEKAGKPSEEIRNANNEQVTKSVYDIEEELKKWEKFAIARLNKSSKRKFEPEVISEDWAEEIEELIKGCSSVTDIKDLFSSLRKGGLEHETIRPNN